MEGYLNAIWQRETEKKRMLIRTIKYKSKVPAVVASASGFNNASVPCCLLCVCRRYQLRRAGVAD
jgi:hypothetical protein